MQLKLYLGLAILFIILYLFIYSFWIEPNYLIKVKTIKLKKNLNYTIAFLSDLHVGDFDPNIRYQKIYNILKKEKPDLIILGGDILGDRNKIDKANEVVLNLSKIAKVLIIPGNWDYYTRFVSIENMEKLKIESKGRIKFLINQFYEVKIENKTICIYGMDWLNPMYKDFNKNCTVRIVVMHSPSYYKYIPDLSNKIDLILAGHTHGGQVNIFGWHPYVPDNLDKEGLVYGLVKKDNTLIYITSGVGVHRLFPFRFGVPPEIVFIKLN